MNDMLRGAIIAALNSLFPVLNLVGVLNLTGDQISIVMLFANNLITLLFLIVKYGQSASGSSASISTENKPSSSE